MLYMGVLRLLATADIIVQLQILCVIVVERRATINNFTSQIKGIPEDT